MPIPEKKLSDFAKSIGFKGIDKYAVNSLTSIAKRLAFNMIDNARFISDACNCKTIRSSHFKAVDQLMRMTLSQHRQVQGKGRKGLNGMNGKKTGAQSGGAIVMPPEFFDANYGPSPYYPEAILAPYQTQLFADPGLTRAEHTIFEAPSFSLTSGLTGGQQTGGGGSKKTSYFIPISLLEEFVEDYNARKSNVGNEVKVSKAALDIMRIAIVQSLVGLLRHIQSSGLASADKLSGGVIKTVITTHAQYAHMRVKQQRKKAVKKN